jgi:hypothetical protein
MSMHQSLNFFPNQLSNVKSPSGVSAAAAAAAAAISSSNNSAFNAAKLAVSLFPNHNNANSSLNPFSIESLLATAPAAAAAAACAASQHQQQQHQQQRIANNNCLNSPTGQKAALFSPLQTTADIYGIFFFTLLFHY